MPPRLGFEKKEESAVSKQPLPWESVPAPICLAVEAQQRKGWVKAGGWILVVVLLAAGFATRWKIALLFGVLYALALVMEKSVAVTSRGLETFHQMQITTNYELWPWRDICAVTYEPDPKDGARMLVYFTKGDRTRRSFFAGEDVQTILKLAREQNPDVKVYDGRKIRGKAAPANRK